MNFQEHFQKHPELMSDSTIGQIQSRPRSNTQKNHVELRRIADICRIPNGDRNSFTKLSDLLDRMADRIGWAMYIKAKDLKVGDEVRLIGNSTDVIKTIATDFSIRLKNNRGAFNPRRMTKV